MRQTILEAPGKIRLATDHPEPRLIAPTDAIIKVSAACICGTDLWSYRGVHAVPEGGRTIGHEAVGVIEEVGADVTRFAPGDFVIVPFDCADGTCPHCLNGAHSACVNSEMLAGAQAEYARVPQADGSLVRTQGQPDPAMIPSLLALSDVMATGWHAAVLAGVKPGDTVAVVGDGAVGLCGVIAARQLGAERVIAMSRHESRQRLALEFGATDLIAERGEAGEERVRELTRGIGADAVLECVGTAESLGTALVITRPGSVVGAVGVPHETQLPLDDMFRRNIGLRIGVASTPSYLPRLLSLVTEGAIEPGKVFDLELPLDQVAEGYRAMDRRTATKVLLRP